MECIVLIVLICAVVYFFTMVFAVPVIVIALGLFNSDDEPASPDKPPHFDHYPDF